jgi:hypothetical protein
MRFTLISIFHILLIHSAYASFDWNENCKQAYTNTIQLKFDKANGILENERSLNPTNSLVYLIENYADYLKIQISEEKNEFDKLKSLKDDRLSIIEEDDSESPWKLYSEAEIHLQWAANRLKFGEYFTAAYEINKAFRLLTENDKKYPHFLPNKKSLGVLYTLIGSVPKQYNWVLSIIGMEGNLDNGLKLMKTTIDEMKTDSIYSSMVEETYFLYAFLKMNLNNNHIDLKNLLKEIENSDYLLLNFAASRIATKLGQNDLAISILENSIKDKDCYPFHYLDYLIAVGKQNKLDSDCIEYFENYVQNFSGLNYKKSALMRISWQYLLMDDELNFKKHKNKVNDIGALFVGADKEAQDFYKNKLKTHKELLKARLYFDGGYYENSLQELDALNQKELENTIYNYLEFNYRKARVYEKLENTYEAINFYKQTIEKAKNETFYFSPKSALQLGLIFEKKGDKNQASKYFQSCIDMQNHLYEKSLEQKAKAGLERLN